jgi:hypothetical protein
MPVILATEEPGRHVGAPLCRLTLPESAASLWGAKLQALHPMSTSIQPLFRPESLKARQLGWLGRPAIALGLPTRVVTFAAVLLLR